MFVHVSAARLRLLRLAYLGTAIFLASQVWPDLVSGERHWEPLAGIAVSFYGALSLLCLWGLRSPLLMLPLLMLQMSYKLVWLMGVWLPSMLAGRADQLHLDGFGLFLPFVAVTVFDLAVIPWRYVLAHMKQPAASH